jgi:hypothetical protein
LDCPNCTTTVDSDVTNLSSLLSVNAVAGYNYYQVPVRMFSPNGSLIYIETQGMNLGVSNSNQSQCEYFFYSNETSQYEKARQSCLYFQVNTTLADYTRNFSLVHAFGAQKAFQITANPVNSGMTTVFTVNIFNSMSYKDYIRLFF